jgi:adenine-specific DNA methylase
MFKRIAKKEVEAPQIDFPKMPEPKEEVKQKPKEKYEVVVKIPTQEVRRIMGEDGIIVNYITVEEFQLMKMTEEANAGNE